MGKSTHFIGQPILGQLINFLDKAKVLEISRLHGGERYVKTFDAWSHLVVMLYAVIMRFDSLREITSAMMMECRKLEHLGVTSLPRRSTLADANTRRSEEIFREIYEDLLTKYRDRLSADSRTGRQPKWMERLRIIDSTTVSLFSNMVFKGVGRNPKTGKKKGGIKVHVSMWAKEYVPDLGTEFSAAARHDHFMLSPWKFGQGDLLAFDRAYIDIAVLDELTSRGVLYVTKMKSNLKYETESATSYMNARGQMEWRDERVKFTKVTRKEDGDSHITTYVIHHARIVSYPDTGKRKVIRLLTNDMDSPYEDIVAIYKKRWEIESLFKQIKQNFPLRYFYGESANAIKVQIWVTLIANLLLTLLQRTVKRSWSFSGLATMVRIMAMYYIDIASFLDNPEKDWEKLLEKASHEPPEDDSSRNMALESCQGTQLALIQ